MKCKACGKNLEIHRTCSRVQMRCKGCGKTYPIHEVADQLDSEAERLLERYNVIICN